MSEQARVAASRIVAEVFAPPSPSTRGSSAGSLPAAVMPVGADTPAADNPAARRARALVAELAAAQEQRRAQQQAQAAATPDAAVVAGTPPVPPEAPPVPPAAPPAPPRVADPGIEPDLFPPPEVDEHGDDRLFAAVTAAHQGVPPEHRDLPPSLEDDVEGPPPPPRQEHPPAAAPVSVPPAPLPVTPAAAPPRADLAARLVSEVLEERAHADASDPGVESAGGDGSPTHRLDVETSPGVGRWLLVTAVGAVTLALLVPLAVAAIRELLALS